MVSARSCQQAPNARVDVNSRFNAPALISSDLSKITLDDHGIILNCSATCERVFGYRLEELAGRHVSILLPHLKDTELVLEDRINARLAYLCHCAMPFQARRRDGEMLDTELYINRLGSHNVAVLLRIRDSEK